MYYTHKLINILTEHQICKHNCQNNAAALLTWGITHFIHDKICKDKQIKDPKKPTKKQKSKTCIHLIYRGRVTHIGVRKREHHGSDEGLSSARLLAITWNNVDLLSNEPSISEVGIKVQWFVVKKMFENLVTKMGAILSRHQATQTCSNGTSTPSAIPLISARYCGKWLFTVSRQFSYTSFPRAVS